MLHYHNTPETQGENESAIYQSSESCDSLSLPAFHVGGAYRIPQFDSFILDFILGKLFSKTQK